MFYVKNGSVKQRRDIVEQIAKLNMPAGLVIAAINFEWTIKRVILALGYDTTKSIRADKKNGFVSNHGILSYKKIWNRQVKRSCVGMKSLAEFFEENGVTWSGHKVKNPGLIEAFHERDKMVHGCECPAGGPYIKVRIALLLKAVDVLEDVVPMYGQSIYKTIQRCKKRKEMLERVGEAE